MRATLVLPVFLLFCLTFISCKFDQDNPATTGPEPDPRINYLGRDSVTTGDYKPQI